MDVEQHPTRHQGPRLRGLVPHLSTDPAEAAAALANGKLAALPTETVYGLGGLATFPGAVERIFATKGRPATHPVIVHIAGSFDIGSWAVDVPPTGYALAEAFWPGPLTLVVPRSPRVSDAVTGGQDTVAIRAPAHPLFQDVLREIRRIGVIAPGIAAPSANRYGRVSPTTAAHVIDELGVVLAPDDVVLDGGPCAVGLESTIVVCDYQSVHIARLGGITREQIEAVVPISDGHDSTPRVPGSHERHYSPTARVVIADAVPAGFPQSAGLLALADVPSRQLQRLASPTTSEEYARVLYDSLRKADELRLEVVVVVPPKGDGISDAIRDRLQRASYRM